MFNRINVSVPIYTWPPSGVQLANVKCTNHECFQGLVHSNRGQGQCSSFLTCIAECKQLDFGLWSLQVVWKCLTGWMNTQRDNWTLIKMGNLLSNVERKTWHKYVKNLKYTYMDLCIFIYTQCTYMCVTCVFVMPILIWKNPNHHIKCNRYQPWGN